MTILDNIIANLRRLFNMPAATEAEIDQALEDRLAQEGQEEPEEIPAPVQEDPPAVQEEEVQEETQPDEAYQAILARLTALEEERDQLRDQVSELKQKHLAAAAAYEQAGPGETAADRYMCETTLRAMGRKR